MSRAAFRKMLVFGLLSGSPRAAPAGGALFLCNGLSPKNRIMNALNQIRETLLMGPGPSCVPPEVYAALSLPIVGHLDPRFIAVMDEIKEMLRPVMQTDHEATMPMSGTGSAGMEACFVNLIEPGDRVLVLVNGVFGKRMADVAGRLGARVDALEFEWGTPVEVPAVGRKLASADYSLVAVVHAETSPAY